MRNKVNIGKKMKILIATHNKEKLHRYSRLLLGVSNLELLSLDDLAITEKAEENFSTNIENAKHKAEFYGELSGIITLSIDEAVETNFLPDNEQPGVYVRRFSGDKKELSDNAVVAVWQEIFKKYPQEDKKFIWSFAVVFYNPGNDSLEMVDIKQISYVAHKISNKKSNGYPLSRVMSPEKNGISYADLSQEDAWKYDIVVFTKFINKFTEWIEKQN